MRDRHSRVVIRECALASLAMGPLSRRRGLRMNPAHGRLGMGESGCAMRVVGKWASGQHWHGARPDARCIVATIRGVRGSGTGGGELLGRGHWRLGVFVPMRGLWSVGERGQCRGVGSGCKSVRVRRATGSPGSGGLVLAGGVIEIRPGGRVGSELR